MCVCVLYSHVGASIILDWGRRVYDYEEGGDTITSFQKRTSSNSIPLNRLIYWYQKQHIEREMVCAL